MAVLSEFALDLCFVRAVGGEGDFAQLVEQELDALFAPYGTWGLSVKTEEEAEVAVVELRGIAPWLTEDEALDYIEDRAGERFRGWLMGYRLTVEPKEDAGACACKH